MKTNKVRDGFFGLCVGDAIGVPFEFKKRQKMKENPASDMVGYGSHMQPPGTWSDDSSLTFCLAESLCLGYNLKDIAKKFCEWEKKAYWTAYDEVFDIGSTTSIAISNLIRGKDPARAGGNSERSNGNGSLMRILPLAFYLEKKEIPETEFYKIIHDVSAITHAHIRSKMACAIYICIAINLIKGDKLSDAFLKAKSRIISYYSKTKDKTELEYFKRIFANNFKELPENEIQSSGYVVHTLEASLWCLLNNSDYKTTVLNAVNLGGDTDTTGAVAGGLAGLIYGVENIPRKWLEKIAKKEEIFQLAERFNKSLNE